MKCKTTEKIAKHHKKNLAHVPAHAIAYLNMFADMVLFPFAHCGMGPDVCMYGRSALSGNEAINHANLRVQQRMAVNIIYMTMILIKLESGWFEQKKAISWDTDKILTPMGWVKHEESFKDVNLRNYEVSVVKEEDCTICKVTKVLVQSRECTWRSLMRK